MQPITSKSSSGAADWQLDAGMAADITLDALFRRAFRVFADRTAVTWEGGQRASAAPGGKRAARIAPARLSCLSWPSRESGELWLCLLLIRRPRVRKMPSRCPAAIKLRLGLDHERSWVVVAEANRFTWPGPDLRALPGRDISTVAYGMLPPTFFARIRDAFLVRFTREDSPTVPRSERNG